MPHRLGQPAAANRELIHCIYASAAKAPLEQGELARLLAQARIRNAMANLTGLLLYADGSFFQVLEGPAAVVDELYARIEFDPRHDQVTQIIREPIHRRTFVDWSMGFHELNRGDLAELPGASDFFLRPRSPMGLNDGRARKLLNAFLAGRWRKHSAPAPASSRSL
jgi:Sensors of blue-light using FAD